MGAYRTVVVGTDGSDSSMRAVDKAAQIAGADAKLIVASAYLPQHEDTRSPTRWVRKATKSRAPRPSTRSCKTPGPGPRCGRQEHRRAAHRRRSGRRPREPGRGGQGRPAGGRQRRSEHDRGPAARVGAGQRLTPRQGRRADRAHHQLVPLPASFSPLGQMWAFSAQHGVVPVAGIDDGVVPIDVENPRGDVVEQLSEITRLPCLADASRKEAVAREELGDPAGRRSIERQRDRSGRVPRRWMTSKASSPIRTVSPPASKRSGLTGSGSASISLAAVGAPVAAATASSACQWSKCWWVVTMSDSFGAKRRTRSMRRSASLAASISRVSPVAEHVTR